MTIVATMVYDHRATMVDEWWLYSSHHSSTIEPPFIYHRATIHLQQSHHSSTIEPFIYHRATTHPPWMPWWLYDRSIVDDHPSTIEPPWQIYHRATYGRSTIGPPLYGTMNGGYHGRSMVALWQRNGCSMVPFMVVLWWPPFIYHRATIHQLQSHHGSTIEPPFIYHRATIHLPQSHYSSTIEPPFIYHRCHHAGIYHRCHHGSMVP